MAAFEVGRDFGDETEAPPVVVIPERMAPCIARCSPELIAWLRRRESILAEMSGIHDGSFEDLCVVAPV